MTKSICEGATVMLRVDDTLDLENVRRWLSDVLAEGHTASVTIHVEAEAPETVSGLDTMQLIHEAVHGLY
ncbi:MAG: hypothetical protein IT320_07775 [Anaerolineae bacterium]|nr:hypothetical protein [Anaerolineae bacterium]